MATSIAVSSKNNVKDKKPIAELGKLQPSAQKRVVSFIQSILEKHNQFSEIRNKFDAIDVAYARYQENADSVITSDGVDRRAAEVTCDVLGRADIVPPIVVSQVDSFVGYWSEIYLSGSPLFPVVSAPQKRSLAESLEAIVDDHANIGAYARQLLMFFRDGAKYNFCGIEVEWAAIDNYALANDITAEGGQKLQRKVKKFNKIKRLNPRNIVWDWSLSPGDVAAEGDYVGYMERMSRTKFKRLLNKLSNEGTVYGNNIVAAMQCGHTGSPSGNPYFKDDPIVSKYVSTANSARNAAPHWDVWFEPGKKGGFAPPPLDSVYDICTMYARIMPKDFGIVAPSPNTPQIWKFITINGQVLIYAERVISAYDLLPILLGQPIEDGLGYQTQSIAEGAIPFQEAATTLYNIRFAAARRAVSDRALYLPDMIKPSDINSKAPAPKIPVNISALSNRKIQDAYYQIPFDLRGTETALQDAQLVSQFAKELHGVNAPRQGQFQKGNKSVQEWNDTMGGSDGRMRLSALTLEHQVFSSMKSMFTLNIFQFGEDGIYISQNSGNEYEVKISELRAANLSFRLADGYTPKAKLASTDLLLTGMQLIGNSPMLQQQYGPFLPGMFAHFMSLGGIKGFEQYDPRYAQMQPQQSFQGIAANTLQVPPQEQSQPTQPVGPNVQPVA